jgi:glycosyltransferase involved in cell wall biosynthesis
MRVLFLTMVKISSFDERGIYTDLLRKFQSEGHEVNVVCPIERRENKNTFILKEDKGKILNVNTFNLQKTNIIEKGLGILAIEYQFLSAIKKYYSNIKFDLILYSTPPITFSKVINYIKKRDGAYSYLLLKDIFPQNAVDMKIIKKGGFLHKMFLKKEKKLYKISDSIGCMSQANVDFVVRHNPELNHLKVEINPNSIEPIERIYSNAEKEKIRVKYNIPINKKVLVYGGNLGKPQGLDFLLKTIEQCNNDSSFFLIIGDGTEFNKIKNWFKMYKPKNAKLLHRLPKEDYDILLAACDIGLIYLHPDFLIPNFPSRLLSYLEMKMPVIAATDRNTDMGEVIEKAQCGYKVISDDIVKMNQVIEELVVKNNLEVMGNNAWNLLQSNYLVDYSYQRIVDKFNGYHNNAKLI